MSIWNFENLEICSLKIHHIQMFNEVIIAASFCLQVAAWVSDVFCNFYLLKNHKIADNSTTPKAREKNKHRFGILRTLEIF
jgi:hypothetical protein